MVRALLAVCFLLAGWSLNLQAQTNMSDGVLVAAKESKKKKKKKKKRKTKSKTTKKTGASAAGKSEMGVAGNVGQVFYNLGMGAEGWYKLADMPLQIGGRFLTTFSKPITGSRTVEGIDINYNAKISQTNIGVVTRYFLFDSLYVSGSLSQSSIAGPYELETAIANQQFFFYSDLKASAMFLTLGFGNQWRFGNYIFGADWVAYSIPMSLKVDPQLANLEDADGNPPAPPIPDASKYEADVKAELEGSLKKVMKLHLLLIHAGIVF